MLVERDREIAGWIARIGAANTEHVMERFAMARSPAYRRIAALVSYGVLERVRLLRGENDLLIPTREGLRWTGHLLLGRPRVSVAAVRHWRICATAAIRLEHEFGAALILSDREVRSWEHTAGRQLASVTPGAAARRPHRPDFAVLADRGGGVAVAVEVELSVKGARRLEAILRGYRRNRQIHAVRYWAAPLPGRAVARAAAATGTEQFVEIRPLAELVPDPDLGGLS